MTTEKVSINRKPEIFGMIFFVAVIFVLVAISAYFIGRGSSRDEDPLLTHKSASVDTTSVIVKDDAMAQREQDLRDQLAASEAAKEKELNEALAEKKANDERFAAMEAKIASLQQPVVVPQSSEPVVMPAGPSSQEEGYVVHHKIYSREVALATNPEEEHSSGWHAAVFTIHGANVPESVRQEVAHNVIEMARQRDPNGTCNWLDARGESPDSNNILRNIARCGGYVKVWYVSDLIDSGPQFRR